MANLKAGTLIGGNMIWSAGNLPLRVVGDKLYINSQEIYTTGFKPTPSTIGAVNKAGDTMTGNLVVPQIKTTSDSALVSNSDTNQGIYINPTDDRTIIGGGNANGSVVIRPNGLGSTAGNTTFNKDGTITASSAPTASSHLTRVDWVQAQDNKRVAKDGDTMTGKLVLNYTSSVKVPVGSTANRGTGVVGDFRFNTEEKSYEGHDGSEWQPIGSGRVKYTTVTANTTASKGRGYLVDTTKANLVVTLPNNAVDSDYVIIGDGSKNATKNPFYVAGFNGDRVVVDRDNCVLKFSYVGNKWTITDGIGESGAIDAANYVSKAGDTMTGPLKISHTHTQLQLIESDNANKNWYVEVNEGEMRMVEAGVGTRLRIQPSTGHVISGGEIKTTGSNSFRHTGGPIGTFWRKDGAALYLMRTEEGQSESGTWSSHRPLTMNLSNGDLSFGHRVYVKDMLTVDNGVAMRGMISNNALTHANKQLLNAGTDQLYLGNRDGIAAMSLQTNSGIVNITNGQTNHRVYHQGFKPTAADVEALSLKGGTVEGNVRVNGVVFPYLPAPVLPKDVTASGIYTCDTGGESKDGYDSLSSVLGVAAGSPVARHFQMMMHSSGTSLKVRAAHTSSPSADGWNPWYRVYTEAFKPTPSDVGALSLSGGTVTGSIAIKNTSPRLDLIETDKGDKSWRVEAFDNKFAITEVGVKVPFEIAAGGNATFTNQLTAARFYATNAAGFVTGTTSDGSKVVIKAESGFAMMAKENASTTKADEFIAISPSSVLQFRQDNGKGEKKYSDWRVYHQGYKPTASEVGALASTGGTVTGTLTIRTSAPVLRLEETDHSTTPYSLVVDGGSIRLNVRTTSALDADVVWKWNEATREFTTPGKLYAIGGLFDGSKRVYSDNNNPSYTQVTNALGRLGYSSASLNDLRHNGLVHLGGSVTERPSGSTGQGDSIIASEWNADAGNQFYMGYNQPIVAIRRKGAGKWSDWSKLYHEQNKPTAADVEALSLKGGTMSGSINLNGSSLNGVNQINSIDGQNIIRRGGDTGVVVGNITGVTTLDCKAGTKIAVRDGGNTYQVYTTGNKPTAAELGVVPMSDVSTGAPDNLLGKIPRISSGSGILEIGRYVDFHTTGSIADYDMRLDCYEKGALNVIGGKFRVGGWDVYHRNDKPTASDVGLNNVPNTVHTSAATASTVAVRTSDGDVVGRLFRSNYPDEGGIGGAMAFRNNNGSNDYIRFCSNKSAIRSWLDTVGFTDNVVRTSGWSNVINRLPYISGSGVMDVGKYIDFQNPGHEGDYFARLYVKDDKTITASNGFSSAYYMMSGSDKARVSSGSAIESAVDKLIGISTHTSQIAKSHQLASLDIDSIANSFPEGVVDGDEGKSASVESMIALLVETCKALNSRISDLESQLETK